MLKWLITLGLLSIVAWRWWTSYRHFLGRFRPNKGASSAHNGRTLGAKPAAKSAAKPLVMTCHHCGVMVPPELGIQQGRYFFCKEHLPGHTDND